MLLKLLLLINKLFLGIHGVTFRIFYLIHHHTLLCYVFVLIYQFNFIFKALLKIYLPSTLLFITLL